MDDKLVVARAYEGRPVTMVLIGKGCGVAFLSRPALAASVARQEIEPIGFPAEDIYRFDARLAEQLVREWESGGPVSWHLASREP